MEKMYIDKLWLWLHTSGVKVVFIMIGALVLLFLSKWFSDRICSGLTRRKDDPEFKKRADTLSGVMQYVFRFVVLVLACMVILPEFGIKIGPILAAAGVVGLAVGFGAQNLVQDIISGFFILMEDQIRVGDVVLIAGTGGVVERLNLRMTILRDMAGSVHYVRNGQINTVTNMTKDYSCYVFSIGVAYREDVDHVIGVVKEIDEEMRNDPEFKDDIIKPLEVMGLDQFADSSIIIKARTTTKPIRQWRVGREFNKRMKKKFDELGIEIPFPHVTLYFGEDKKGEAPPMRVDMKSLPMAGE